jgi:hypothetical protein
MQLRYKKHGYWVSRASQPSAHWVYCITSTMVWEFLLQGLRHNARGASTLLHSATPACRADGSSRFFDLHISIAELLNLYLRYNNDVTAWISLDQVSIRPNFSRAHRKVSTVPRYPFPCAGDVIHPALRFTLLWIQSPQPPLPTPMHAGPYRQAS